MVVPPRGRAVMRWLKAEGDGTSGLRRMPAPMSDGLGMKACRSQHRGEKRVLILAVAVLVTEHLTGGVGLVAADSERDADVADLRCDVGVDGANLLLVGGLAGDDFRGFSLDVGVGNHAVAL